jgi:hypothetical protein
MHRNSISYVYRENVSIYEVVLEAVNSSRCYLEFEISYTWVLIEFDVHAILFLVFQYRLMVKSVIELRIEIHLRMQNKPIQVFQLIQATTVVKALLYKNSV